MTPFDLRQREITTLDDFVAIYHEADHARDYIVSPEQRDRIYGLLQNQAPGQASLDGDDVRWIGMTFRCEA